MAWRRAWKALEARSLQSRGPGLDGSHSPAGAARLDGARYRIDRS